MTTVKQENESCPFLPILPGVMSSPAPPLPNPSLMSQWNPPILSPTLSSSIPSLNPCLRGLPLNELLPASLPLTAHEENRSTSALHTSGYARKTVADSASIRDARIYVPAVEQSTGSTITVLQVDLDFTPWWMAPEYPIFTTPTIRDNPTSRMATWVWHTMLDDTAIRLVIYRFDKTFRTYVQHLNSDRNWSFVQGHTTRIWKEALATRRQLGYRLVEIMVAAQL